MGDGSPRPLRPSTPVIPAQLICKSMQIKPAFENAELKIKKNSSWERYRFWLPIGTRTWTIYIGQLKVKDSCGDGRTREIEKTAAQEGEYTKGLVKTIKALSQLEQRKTEAEEVYHLRMAAFLTLALHSVGGWM